jgi:hypothetical protein
MFKYVIYDENNEMMRKAKTYAHAKYLCSMRKGWYVKKVVVDLSMFEAAPF